MTELKDSTQSEVAPRSQRESTMLNSSEMLFAKGQPTTLEEILAGLPVREVADRLVAGYFNCKVQPCMLYLLHHVVYC